MTLVMVHAQDHLMTSILAKELIAELIAIYRAQPLHALPGQTRWPGLIPRGHYVTS